MAGILPIVSDCCEECCTGASVDCDAIASASTVVDTLAILRLTTYSDHKTVWLLGQLAAGDGGGGLYYFDAASTAADAPMAVVRPTAIAVGSAGRWLKHI